LFLQGFVIEVIKEAHHPELVEVLAKEASYGGLARAGVAEEAEVEALRNTLLHRHFALGADLRVEEESFLLHLRGEQTILKEYEKEQQPQKREIKQKDEHKIKKGMR
jgi:hypothetical protein